MDWFAAPNYWFARWGVQGGLRAGLSSRLRERARPVPRAAGRARAAPRSSLSGSDAVPGRAEPLPPGLLRPRASGGGVERCPPRRGDRARTPRRRPALGVCARLAGALGALPLYRQRGATVLLVRLGKSPARSGVPRRLPGKRPYTSAPSDTLPLPLARRPGGARRGTDQAPGRSLLAGSHLSRLPPRDPADAESAQLVCPSHAPVVSSARGPRQL